MITYTNMTEEERIILPDLYMYEMTIPDLTSGSKCNFCLKLTARWFYGSRSLVQGELNMTDESKVSSFRAAHRASSTTTTCVVINLREPPPIPELSCPANKPIEVTRISVGCYGPGWDRLWTEELAAQR